MFQVYIIGVNPMDKADIRSKKTSYFQKKKGATLFTALVVTSMVLAIGASISSIAFKSARLSSIGRDSQAAYYASEAGLECAMYWVKKSEAFNPAEPQMTIRCSNSNINVTRSSPCAVGNCTFSFRVEFPGVSYCADVRVVKGTTPNPPTIIESRGYNTCVSGVRRLERRVRFRT
jgi:Tfp pilus assembly protein PilX